MRYVEPSRRRPARAASVRRSGKQKAIKSFSIRFAARREDERAVLENVGKSTKTNHRNTHGGTPNGLSGGTAGELSPRCGGFKSFRGGGRKARPPTAKERREAVRRWRRHAKRRKTRQIRSDAGSVERCERTQGIHAAQSAEHGIQGPAAEVSAAALRDPLFRQGLAGMGRGQGRFGIVE